MAKNNNSTSTKKSSFLKILWWALAPILITLIFFGAHSMLSKRETAEEVKSSLSKSTSAKPQEKVEWIMSFLVLDKKMEQEKENGQESYYEVQVCGLTSNDLEITVTYKSLGGGEKTTKLTRWNKNKFYGGWIENTHPKKRKDNDIFSLINDQTPFSKIVEGVSGKKVKIFPQFQGYVGENEIEVKIFKRVSSG